MIFRRTMQTAWRLRKYGSHGRVLSSIQAGAFHRRVDTLHNDMGEGDNGQRQSRALLTTVTQRYGRRRSSGAVSDRCCYRGIIRCRPLSRRCPHRAHRALPVSIVIAAPFIAASIAADACAVVTAVAALCSPPSSPPRHLAPSSSVVIADFAALAAPLWRRLSPFRHLRSLSCHHFGPLFTGAFVTDCLP